jgi:arylsulfatase A-like enzyme
VDLSRLAGRTIDLSVDVEGPPATVSLANLDLVGRAEDSDPPNVILYLIDCLRADHVGAYGYSRPTTPAIDALARDGVVFERLYSCASWTKPSVGCLFTSLYPQEHGARTVDDSLSPERLTLADALASQGYTTAAWVANPIVGARGFGMVRGFDSVRQLADQPKSVAVNRVKGDAAEITRSVVPWLKHMSERRFFLYIHSLDLHAEYLPRPPFDRMFVRAESTGVARDLDLYDNELAYNDREVGRLVDALKSLGLYDRTIIAVTADHGEEFGEHGRFRHGHSLFDPLLHVPFIVKPARSQHRGLRVPALASNVDIAPTLLGFAGLPVPSAFKHLGLQPTLESRAGQPRPYVFAEQLSPKEVLYAARDPRFKYIHQLLPEPGQFLYDLEHDPGEERNLWPSVPKPAEGVVAALLAFMQSAQEGYHLSISVPESGMAITVDASTEGVFALVQRFGMATEESLQIGPDRRRFRYRFQADGLPRHLVIQTRPPGENIRFSLKADEAFFPPRDILLAGRGHPAVVPFLIRASALGGGPGKESGPVRAGGERAELWYSVAAPSGPPAKIDPELAEKVRALGYVH